MAALTMTDEQAAKLLHVLERLARVVGAMAQDTYWHNQMFDIIADIEQLSLSVRGNHDE